MSSRTTQPTIAPSAGPTYEPDERGSKEALLADYSATVGVVHQLVDVRFKLLAFIPALTGAAVGLLATRSGVPLQQAVLGAGGLMFALGVVLYDLRNSQHYNSAIGRAKFLERTMLFPPAPREDPDGERDENGGVYGSRGDTDNAMAAKTRDQFLRLPVRHGPALALVYTATLAAWVWTICDAAADGLAGRRNVDWIARNNAFSWIAVHADWFALAVTIGAGVIVLREFQRHDSWPR